jgi:hypothetical protein
MLKTVALAKDGSFEATVLEPGPYLVCAFRDPLPAVTALVNGAAAPPVQRLNQLCKTVTLKPDRAESVQVRLTSVAEVAR